jgi:hypothetical protein
MTIVEGYFDEIGFSESECTNFHWSDADLVVEFSRGIDLGGSRHPLSGSFMFDQPCRMIFKGVVFSDLSVSEYLGAPNKFRTIHFEKSGLPGQREGESYDEYHLEGSMQATEPKGWFNWELKAESFALDDLCDS